MTSQLALWHRATIFCMSRLFTCHLFISFYYKLRAKASYIITMLSFSMAQADLHMNMNMVNPSKIINVHDIQCDILAQCIQDIDANSKKYHLHFMLDVLNYGTALDIVNSLNCIEMNLANMITMERKISPFLSARELQRVGLTMEMVDVVVKSNT
jgi:hypothetical protein